MSNSFSFPGLASGLDTRNIVSQLVAVKRQQLLRQPTTEAQTVDAKSSAFSSIKSLLQSLKTAADTLNNTNNSAYIAKKATSSQTTVATIGTVTSADAALGSYTLSNISQLAQGDKVIFNGVTDISATTFGTGTLSFTYKGTTSTVTIDTTNNTLDGIKSAINNANIGISASIVNDGSDTSPYRLVLSAKDTGSDTTITHNLASITSLTVDATASTAEENEAQDAEFLINGVSFVSKSNAVSNAIPGVTFNLLKEETTTTTNITVANDTAAVIGNISAFVTAYNNTLKKLKEYTYRDPDTGRASAVASDSLVQDLSSNLRQTMTKRLGLAGYAYQSLADIGITSGTNGELAIDRTKLTTALETKPTDVRMLFQGVSGNDGISERIYSIADRYAKTSGVLDARMTQYTKRKDELTKLIADRQDQITEYQKKLEAQFVNMERAVNRAKNQQGAVDNLAAFINGLNG